MGEEHNEQVLFLFGVAKVEQRSDSCDYSRKREYTAVNNLVGPS
jgi:hypothetical protein